MTKTWTAVSTHEGEYEELKIAHAILKAKYSEAKLVICPRYLNELSKVKAYFKTDLSVSFNETLGNMDPYFRMADVVFVGGTFNKYVGGHNILEPVSYKKPTLIGPYTDKINDLIEACEAVIQVCNGTELGEKLIELFSDEAWSRVISEKCYVAYLKSREGVLESYLALITPIIDSQLSKSR